MAVRRLSPSGAPIHGGTFITLFGAGFRAPRDECADDGANATSNVTDASNATANGTDATSANATISGNATVSANTTSSVNASNTTTDSVTASDVPSCNVSVAPVNVTQPRCKFAFSGSHVAATVYGSSNVVGDLICQAPAAPMTGLAPVLVSLNGVDYSSFPSSAGVLGVYAVFFYHPCAMSAIEPPGGPVLGNTPVRFIGGGLADFGVIEHVHAGIPTPTFLRVVSMGTANGARATRIVPREFGWLGGAHGGSLCLFAGLLAPTCACRRRVHDERQGTWRAQFDTWCALHVGGGGDEQPPRPHAQRVGRRARLVAPHYDGTQYQPSRIRRAHLCARRLAAE
jgi:hypothetical protein